MIEKVIKFKKEMILSVGIICTLFLTSIKAFAYIDVKNTLDNNIVDTSKYSNINMGNDFLTAYKVFDNNVFYFDAKNMLIQDLEDKSKYTVLYKLDVDPRQERDWGVIGFGSKGENYYNKYVKTTLKFCDSSKYEIIDFSPSDNVVEDKDDSIFKYINGSAYYSKRGSRTLTNDTNVEKTIHQAKYEYTSINRDSNPLTANQDILYGSITFRVKNDFRKIKYDLKHEVQFERTFGHVDTEGYRVLFKTYEITL